MLPEIVLFAKTEDALRRNSDFFIPDLPRFVILFINRRIQAIWIKTYHFCQKFPCPMDGLSFEIISKREITEHFKKRTMSCSFTYIFNITCTNTFLTSSHTFFRWNYLTCKIWLQRCHTGIDKKKTLIVMWYERKTLHHQMLFALEKVKEHLSQFIYSVFLHNFLLII